MFDNHNGGNNNTYIIFQVQNNYYFNSPQQDGKKPEPEKAKKSFPEWLKSLSEVGTYLKSIITDILWFVVLCSVGHHAPIKPNNETKEKGATVLSTVSPNEYYKRILSMTHVDKKKICMSA